MQKHKKQKNALLITVTVLVLVAAAGAWLYFNSLKPVLEITSDKPAYFTVDKPSVEIRLYNPLNADSGEIRISYDKEIFKLIDSVETNGVSIRELDNSLIFTLSNEYFALKNPVVSQLTFERAADGVFGKCNFIFDQANTKLTAGADNLEISAYKDKTVTIGVVPEL